MRSTDSEISGLTIESEFASVRVEVDTGGNGPRLAIIDLRSGNRGFLDALEMESLVYARHEDLTHMLDPGATRWSGPS